MEDIEIWRDILEFEDRYRISNLGNIYSKYKNKLITPSKDKDGYRYIRLYSVNGLHKFLG